ncbi:MAG TPA: hypothetical protein VMA72_05085 [Streptosporangiaceae bacterium]|nr:hypothetical protein [Streptosporangiaceae bacterium]
MADGPSGLLRAFLAADVYTDKGRLRSDDLLVRERVGQELGSAAAAIRNLISAWRADRVPASTREQPFPPAAVMEPIRRAERLVKSIEGASVAVRGLPLLNQDKVWDRVRHVGLDELMQFDWTLVGEAVAIASGVQAAAALDELDIAAAEARLRTIGEVMADRQRYIEIS